MKSVLKKAVVASVPAALAITASPARADEVQSIAAQAIAQIASQPAVPPPPADPVLIFPPGGTFIINGMRP